MKKKSKTFSEFKEENKKEPVKEMKINTKENKKESINRIKLQIEKEPCEKMKKLLRLVINRIEGL